MALSPVTPGVQGLPVCNRAFRAAEGSDINITGCSNVVVVTGEQTRKGYLPQGEVQSKIVDLKRSFHETEAMRKARSLLQQFDHVTLIGAPGEGKTSIAYMLCDEYQANNYDVIFVDDVDDFDEKQCNTIESDTCIVMDDIFGTIGISTNLQKIKRILDTLDTLVKRKRTQRPGSSYANTSNQDPLSPGATQETVSVNVKIIFTSKTYNFNEGSKNFPQFEVNIFRKQTICDLSQSLSKESKRTILSNFQKLYPQVDLSEQDINTITNCETSVCGFPLTCKMYFSQPVYQVNCVKFFKEPLSYLRSNIDALILEGGGRKAFLILLVLCGGKLDLAKFQENPEQATSKNIIESLRKVVPDITDVYKQAKNFHGTFCDIQESVVTFSHPSVYDAVTCAMVNACPLVLLEHCTLKFIFERVRLSKNEESDISVNPGSNIVYVNAVEYKERLLIRMSEFIQQGYFRLTLSHPMFKDEHVFLRVLDKISKHLHNIVDCKDRESGESFLYWCTFSHSEYIVQQTLKCIHHIKEDVLNSIKGCIQNGNLNAMILLFQQIQINDNIPLKTLANSCMLILDAARYGNVHIFQHLKEKGTDLEPTDREGKTILHIACEFGHKRIVDNIPTVHLNEFIVTRDFQGRTPLMICAKSGHLKLFKFLLDKGAALDTKDYSNDTCLHLAAKGGHVTVARHILSLDRDCLAARGAHGRTPLMAAARHSREDMFKLLLEHSDPTLSDDEDNTTLILATIGGSESIVRDLLQFLHNSIDRRGKFQCTAIMVAALFGHENVFDLLLSNGASTSLIDHMYNTCMHCACFGKNNNICKKLTQVYNTSIHNKNGHGQTPLMIAAREGCKDIVEHLWSKGASLMITDNQNCNPLDLACLSGKIELVDYLLNLQEWNLNKRLLNGCTPIMVACACGHEDIFNKVRDGSNLQLTNDYGCDLLWLASYGGNVSIMEKLLESFDINSRGENGYTPAMVAAKRGQRDTFDLAVKGGANLKLKDDYGNDMLYLASTSGEESIVNYLLSRGFNINKAGECGRTPVMAASRLGNINVVQLLESEGADLSRKDDKGNDSLNLAAKSKNKEIVPYLLSLNAFDPTAKGEGKRPPLLNAIDCGHEQAYNALLCTPGVDKMASYCLILAARSGLVATVRKILKTDVDINQRSGRGFSPIMNAMVKGHYKIFNLLHERGANLSFRDSVGNDSLALAAMGGCSLIVTTLLSLNKFNLDGEQNRGRFPPVLLAAMHGHQATFDWMVRANCDRSLEMHGRNILHFACMGGNVEIIRYLLSLETFDINVRDPDGHTPIMLAVYCGNRMAFDLLMERGSELYLKDKQGNSCLHLATIYHQTELLRHMVSLGVYDVNSINQKGQTALMIAAEEGLVRPFFLLLSEGANEALQDCEGNDLSSLAARGGKKPILRYLKMPVDEEGYSLSLTSRQVSRNNPRRCVVS